MKAAKRGSFTSCSKTCSWLSRFRAAMCVWIRSEHGAFLRGTIGSVAVLLCALGEITTTSLPNSTAPSRSTAMRFTICASVLTCMITARR